MTKHFAIFILVITTVFSASLKLGVPETVYNLPQFNILGELVRESFKGINYQVDFVSLPSNRALYEADTGNLDGVFPYFPEAIKDYKNLFIIKERIGGANITAYSSIGNLKIKTWNDLKGKKIAYLLGSKLIEERLKKLAIDSKDLTQAKDYISLLKLINSSRVDVILLDKVAYESIKTKKTLLVETVLENSEVFLSLNKNYLNLKNPLRKRDKKVQK